jgi:uncharacterized membrane-anchored protein YitT (DUF2179 family)
MTKRRSAWLLVLVGAALTVTGIGLVYVPAALAVGGLAVAAVGLFGLDVKK